MDMNTGPLIGLNADRFTPLVRMLPYTAIKWFDNPPPPTNFEANFLPKHALEGLWLIEVFPWRLRVGGT